MRVVVIRHHDVDSAGFIAAAFEARGAALDVHLFPDDGPLPALGGRVEAMDHKEIGWTLVDSVDHELIPPGPWLEFHGDRCLLPPGTTVLARNEVAVQAFRIGRHLAVQFHPEVDGPQLKRWLDAGGDAEAEQSGLSPDQFLADTIREEPAARDRADRLVAAALRIRSEASA